MEEDRQKEKCGKEKIKGERKRRYRGRERICPLDLTALARLADKLAELIVLARHVLLKNRPRDYQLLKVKTYVYLYQV